MKRWLLTVVLLAPLLAAAQTPSAAASGATQPVLRAQMSDPAAVQPVQPVGSPPSDVIPSAPENPTPPTSQAGAVGQQAAPGQWVYTGQYGWVWMPYGDGYTYVPSEGGVPNMYVYYPAVGWTWVVAPWIWGWGPSPYWGIYGTVGFGWYGYGYGTWYGYAGPYAGWYGRGYWYGGRWVGAPYHPAGPRGGGYVPPGGAYHGGGAFHGGGYAAPHGGGMSMGGHGGGGHR
jgi:hypothetical protein